MAVDVNAADAIGGDADQVGRVPLIWMSSPPGQPELATREPGSLVLTIASDGPPGSVTTSVATGPHADKLRTAAAMEAIIVRFMLDTLSVR